MRKFIPLYEPFITKAEEKYVIRSIKSKWISYLGKNIKVFEDKFKKLIKVKYVTTVNNGTAAVHSALLALELEKPAEILVPSLTFAASANVALYSGLKVKFIDCDIDKWTIDILDLEKKITNQTKAILAVNLYGNPVNYDEILKLSKKYKLKIIEDCAQSIGSRYKKRYTGAIGDTAGFSFFGNKTITTGEGGITVTNNKKYYDKILRYKDQYMNKERRYYHEKLGYNYRMTDLQAAVGLGQIEKISYIMKRKKEIDNLYRQKLKNKNILFQKFEEHSDVIPWLTSIRISSIKTEKQQYALMKKLYKKGIDTRPGFIPLDNMPYFKAGVKTKTANLIYKQIISLPSFPGMTKKQQLYIIKTVLEIL